MNPVRGRYFIPSLFVAAVCLVAVNTWLAFNSLRVLEQSQYWVEHTYQVIAQVEIILGSVKDAETGQRGFLITGDDQFLQPYKDALGDLPGELDSFQTLTADNAAQQRWIAEMRVRVFRRLALLQKGIEMRRGGENQSEAALAATGGGKVEMDALRGLANQMENEERRLLAVRTRDAQSNRLKARITVGFASALDFALLLFVFRYFIRERGLRVASELQAKTLADTNFKLAQASSLAEAKANEVRALNATLEERVRQRTAELETSNRELEAFSYSVSHDLRAPLRTVDGFSLALEEDYADAVDLTGRDYIARVRSAVQRMGQLIDALLQLSRITRAELDRATFDMSELANSIAAAIRLENPGRQIEFRIEPGLSAAGDSRLMRVALENLLGNSVKFTSKISAALVEFGWDQEENAFYVRDNGAGFDMDYAGKLFGAFHRLHGDKDFKGSGIGLATVARVIHRHHGRIWALAAVNRGATFWFTVS
jgi:signal transduction histidine kinase